MISASQLDLNMTENEQNILYRSCCKSNVCMTRTKMKRKLRNVIFFGKRMVYQWIPFIYLFIHSLLKKKQKLQNVVFY